MASFLQIFRLTFVFFSLYLMGDAFYRWDGFRYYASFSEFLPSVGLIAILWSIIAVFVALSIWLPLRVMEWIFRQMRLKIRMEQMLVFCSIFSFFIIILLSGKVFKIYYLPRFIQWNLTSFLVVTVTALFLTWLFRRKAESWVTVVQERIAPLVWIFGIFIVLSVSVVTFKALWKGPDKVIAVKSNELLVSNNGKPNILLITFDTLTARDMSVYGYQKPTTPFINEWAKTASLFTNAKAESHITTPTTASLMTGKRVWTHQTYHIAGSSKPVKSETENVPLMLKKNGYYNMAFVVNPLASVRKLGISGGFDVAPIETGFSRQATLFGHIDAYLFKLFGDKIRLHNWILQRDFILFKLINKVSRNLSRTTAPPERAFEKFLSVLNDGIPEPYFAWIHLFPPHDPYLPPEPYMGMFDSSPNLRTYKSQDAVVKKVSRYHSYYKEFPPEVKPDVDILRARYDEFISYCDKQFETFITQLSKKGILKKTIIILSADHGESFEHNYIKHSFNNLYEQITSIPLIIKEPSQVEGRIIDDLTEQIDIPATIIDLAGIQIPEWVEGRSLVPLMRGRWLPSRPAFSMSLENQASRGNEIKRGKIAVWEGDYKLIHQLEDKKTMLFNLKKDPGELDNLFYKEPERGRHLLRLIHENLKKANEKISSRE